MVKIAFDFVGHESGRPGVEVLWASKASTSERHFVLENIPFFVDNVSLGDVIEAELDEQGDRFNFKSIAKLGGHSTFRVSLKVEYRDDPLAVRRLQQVLDTSDVYEGGTSAFYALDASSQEVREALLAMLVAGEDMWDFETSTHDV